MPPLLLSGPDQPYHANEIGSVEETDDDGGCGIGEGRAEEIGGEGFVVLEGGSEGEGVGFEGFSSEGDKGVGVTRCK